MNMKPKIILDDLKLGPKYQNLILHIVIVVDQRWIK